MRHTSVGDRLTRLLSGVVRGYLSDESDYSLLRWAIIIWLVGVVVARLCVLVAPFL